MCGKTHGMLWWRTRNLYALTLHYSMLKDERVRADAARTIFDVKEAADRLG
jgi:hypothetical protein